MSIRTLVLAVSTSIFSALVYADASPAAAGELILEMGEEKETFSIRNCRADEYVNGNLTVEYDVTATGSFRGRPAIVLLTKSRPTQSTQYFQHADIYLGEMLPGQESLSTVELQRQLIDLGAGFEARETRALEEKYRKRFESAQAEGQSPEKMMELMNEQVLEMDRIQAQAAAMRYPDIRIHGALSNTGASAHFAGSSWTHPDPDIPEFQNLPANPEIWVTCSE